MPPIIDLANFQISRLVWVAQALRSKGFSGGTAVLVMRRKLLLVGLTILILGASVTGFGLVRVEGSSTRSTRVTAYSQGEYITSVINLSVPSVLTVESSSKNSGLIPVYALSLVNESNIYLYAVRPTASSGGIYSYTNISGDYYYVVFSNVTPTVSYLITPLKAAVYATLIFTGIVFSIVGVVAVILGVVLKTPPKPVI